MPIKRLLAMIALVVLTTLPAATATARQDQDRDTYCDDIAAYIDMVDGQVVEEMHALVTTPGWAEDARMTEGLLESATDGEINPLVEYISVPGMVLSGIDQADVPESAAALHGSATTYWVTTSDMIEAMIKDGPSASYPFLETMDEAGEENIAAQAEIVERCPEIPQSYEDAQARLDTLFDVLDNEGDPGMLADADPEDLEGMGFFFLFFGEEDAEAERVTAASTPFIVVTPED